MPENYQKDIKALSLNAETLQKLLPLNGDAVRLFLCIASSGKSASECGALLAIPPDEADRLAGLLSREKLIVPPRAASADAPEYSGGDIAARIRDNTGFCWLVDFVQNLIGRTMTSNDAAVLLRIHEWLGMEIDVIAVLARFCVDRYEHEKGEGRKPPVRFFQTEAVRWTDEGITTVEEADRYITRASQRFNLRGAVLARLNIRDVSESVDKYIDGWISMGFGEDAIYKAYDITVLKTGGLKWQYMNTILKNWHEKGLHTPDEIAAGDQKPKTRAAGAAAPKLDAKAAVLRNKSYLK